VTLLVVIVSDPFGCDDLDHGGLSLASFMFTFLVVTCDPLGHNPHVDRHLPSPPSWLQLLMTFLVVMIVILVV
jgi:hypothetical protein